MLACHLRWSPAPRAAIICTKFPRPRSAYLFILNCSLCHFTYWFVLWVLTHNLNSLRTFKSMSLLINLIAIQGHARLPSVTFWCLRDAKKWEASCTADASVNSYSLPWSKLEIAVILLRNVHIFDSTILLLRIHGKEIIRKVRTDKSRKTLSTVHTDRSEDTHMSTPGERFKKWHRTHALWYYPVITLLVQEWEGSAFGNDNLRNLDSSFHWKNKTKQNKRCENIQNSL